MFAAAYSQATAFTRPVIISRRHVDGTCDSSIGSFVIVNDEGWIVTAAHIVNEYMNLEQSKQNYEKYLADRAAIENDKGLLPDQKRKRIRQMGTPDPKAITNFSFWWSGDGVVPKNIVRLGAGDPVQAGDLAVGRLEPFDPGSVSHYPLFKDHTKPISSGTSLCRLGFSVSLDNPDV